MMAQIEERSSGGVDGEQDIKTEGVEGAMFPEVSLLDQIQCGEEKEGESILYGCKHQDRGQAEEREEGEGTLYGRTPFEIPISTPKSRQSTSFLEDLSHLGIEMPLQRPRFTGYSTRQYRMAA